MKRRPILLLILAVAILAVSALAVDTTAPTQTASTDTKAAAPTAAAPTINWLDYDKGMAMQAGTKKHMLVDFTASWCGWCRKMEKETFSQPAVIQMVNDNFVAVKVWGDSDKEMEINGYKISEKNLTAEYRVTGFPCFWFVSAEGTRIGPLSGYRGADQFLGALTYVKDYKYDTTRVAKQPEAEKTETEKTDAQTAQPGQN